MLVKTLKMTSPLVNPACKAAPISDTACALAASVAALLTTLLTKSVANCSLDRKLGYESVKTDFCVKTLTICLVVMPADRASSS